MKKLTDCTENSELEILEVGGENEVQDRLHSFGIWPGEKIVLIKKGRGKSPVVIQVGETTLALGREVGEGVLVVNHTVIPSQAEGSLSKK